MKKNKDLGLFVQVILCACAIIFFIISLFEKEFYNVAECLVGLILFVMAYNNQMTYKRKHFSAIYIVFGSLLIMSYVMNIMNVG